MNLSSTKVGSAAERAALAVAIHDADAHLRTEVTRAVEALRALKPHESILGTEAAGTVARTVEEVLHRLGRKELAVVVVGEKKAGKSTFLNAILGAPVLGAAKRECTATITFIRKGARATYLAKLVGGQTRQFVDPSMYWRAETDVTLARLRASLGDQHVDGVQREPPADRSELEREASRAQLEYSSRTTARDELAMRSARARERLAAAKRQEERDTAGAREMEAKQRVLAEQYEAARREEAGARANAMPAELRRDAVPAPQAPDEARRSLERAAERVEHLQRSLPFFLQPLPWWAVWSLALRVLLGWYYRAARRAIVEARIAHEVAERDLVVAEAAARVASLAGSLQRIEHDAGERRLNLAMNQRAIAAAEGEDGELSSALQRAESAVVAARKATLLIEARLVVSTRRKLDLETETAFRREIHALTDMEKEGAQVAELSIAYPAAHLPDGITIIDTPGVNTDNQTNRDRAWSVIRREADGCLLVSDLQQVVSESTQKFLREVRTIVPHILLVMSKVDKALENAEGTGDDDAWAQVEEARRTGVRRFAKQVGRPAQEVFSIAVAAERSLNGEAGRDGIGARFPSEVAKLFELLESERAVLLGARAAAGIRDCVQRIGEAHARAEASYASRIATLEQQRLPNPQAFQTEQLAAVEEELRAAADKIVVASRKELGRAMRRVEEQWIGSLLSCQSKDEVKAALAHFEHQGAEAMGWVRSEIDRTVAKRSADAVKKLEAPLFAGLRERYRIAQKIAGSGGSISLGVDSNAIYVNARGIESGLGDVVSTFEGEQLALGAGGAVAGAIVGTFIFPGVGTAIGGAIGALAGLFKTLESLKSDCATQIRSGLEGAHENLDRQLLAMGPVLDAGLRSALWDALGDAVARFHIWIVGLLRQESLAIDAERALLGHLIELKGRLQGHDARLQELQAAAAAVSRGLCR